MLLQLCPVLREAFEDVRADLLNLVKCKCSALSHLFPLLSAGLGALALPKAGLSRSGLGRASFDPCPG